MNWIPDSDAGGISHRRFPAFSLWLLPVLLTLFSNAAAQETAVLNGYVRDARSAETLIMANVFLEETLKGATTNNSGYYTITDLPPGEYTLVVSYIGYQDYRQKISITPGATLRRDIDLEPGYVEGRQVIVEAQNTLEEEKPVGVLTIHPDLVQNLPSVLEADLFRSIQLLPGVKAASDFSSGLYIRGGSPDQTLILLDRTTVYNPSHFFGFFSTFNTDAIKDVRLYKGGYPAEYGGRLGSVLDVYNRDGNRRQFQGRAAVGLLASRVNLEGPLPKGSYMMAVRRSTLEPLLSVLRKNVDDVPDVFYFLDLNGKINFDPGPNDRINLAFYSGSDNVKFPFADDARFNLNYGNRTVSGNWTHVFSPRLFSNFTATASGYFSHPRIILAGTPIERDNEISDYSLKGDFEYFPGSGHQVLAGFWTGDLTLTIKGRFDKEETLNERIGSRYASFYLQDTWRISPLWKLKIGLRGNFFSRGEYFRAEPRVALEYSYTRNLLFQAAYGRYYQFLTLITNEAFSGFDTWLTTAEGVPPAWGDQFVLGMKARLSQSYSLDMETYYRTMRDLFELDPRVPDPAGLDYPDLFRFGRGFAYGAEVMLEKRSGPLTGFVGYTLGSSRRRFFGYNDGRFFPPKYDRLHDVNLVMNYRLSRKWRATAVFNYATGQAITRVLGTYTVTLPTRSDDREPFIVGGINRSRLPAYHRLDIGFARNGKFFGLGNYQLQLQVINVYSRRNVWFYSYDFADQPISRDEVRMLPIIPNISLQVDF